MSVTRNEAHIAEWHETETTTPTGFPDTAGIDGAPTRTVSAVVGVRTEEVLDTPDGLGRR